MTWPDKSPEPTPINNIASRLPVGASVHRLGAGFTPRVGGGCHLRPCRVAPVQAVLHRRDFDRAFLARHDNPTPEDRLEPHRRGHIIELYRRRFSGVGFGGMVVLTLLVVYACNRRHRSSQITQS